MIVLLVVCGGIGAVCRYLVDAWLKPRTAVPLGSLIVNVLGSFFLGLVAPISGWGPVMGTGFCGGFTTFSTAMVEHIALLRERRPLLAVVHIVVMVLCCLAAAMAGLTISPR